MKTSIDIYADPIKEVLEALSSNTEIGISSSHAEEVRRAEGTNTTKNPYRFFVPLLLLTYLIPPSILSLWFISQGVFAVAAILLSGAFIMGAGLYGLVYGVLRAEKKRQRLMRSMESAKYMVIRDGTEQKVSGKSLVSGDIIIFNKASETVIPADCRLISCTSMSIKHAWEYSFLNGTQQHPEQKYLLAGLETNYIDAICLVVATGKNRKICGMYDAHPAGPLVQHIGRLGFWYFAITLLTISIAALTGYLLPISYAVAAGTPVLLPFFLLKKGRGLRMQTLHEVPDHIIYPLEHLLEPKVKEAVVILSEVTLPLKQLKTEEEETRATVSQFLELLSLSIRDDEASHHGKLLRKIVANAKRLGMRIDNMTDWEYDTTLSTVTLDATTSSYRYWSSFTMRSEDTEDTLHLLCHDAANILEHSTYLWDAKEHTMRRRFISGEKQKLEATLKEHLNSGSLVYGLALREHAHEDAPLIYIGSIVIPRKVKTAELSILRNYANNNHAVVLYTELDVTRTFALDVLKVPEKHLFEKSSDISFSTLRRHDFFLANRASALDIARMHSSLSGAVLVDTLEDRYVSSLYFWPRHMRFESTGSISFFSWLKTHVHKARDGFTKMAQYVGLLCISSALLLVIVLLSKPTDFYRIFTTVSIATTLIGLIGICLHITDKKTHHKKIHQLALLDTEQAMTGARVILGAGLTAGLYYLLARENGTLMAMSKELIYFAIVGLSAGSISRFTADTKSLLHTMLVTLFFALIAAGGYIFLFAEESLLPKDLQILFVVSVLLGNMMWIIASYQSVPKNEQ